MWVCVLSLYTGCTTKEIRDRFKKLALKWHPDKNIDNPDEAQKVCTAELLARGRVTSCAVNTFYFSFRNSKPYLQLTLNWCPQTQRKKTMIFLT